MQNHVLWAWILIQKITLPKNVVPFRKKLSNYNVGYRNQVYTWPDALDMPVIKVQFNFI